MITRRGLHASLAPVVLGACGAYGRDTREPSLTPAASAARATSAPSVPGSVQGKPVAGEVVVFAAASLADAFETMWKGFRSRPGNETVAVTASYGASSTLRAQLLEGARADVYAAADPAQMDLAITSRLVDGEATTFARNRLVLVVPKGNPARVETLADLARPGLKFVTTPAEVPIGAYARAALKKLAADPRFGGGIEARILRNVVSEEANVRQVVVKVRLGEADAGICYATDVIADASGDAVAIEIPEAFNVNVECRIAVLQGAPAPVAARRLVAFVTSPDGRAILGAAGFGLD